ncbi:MAG TPA: ATP-binding protein [Pyrinomonadaceae bacterium]|nr:ATP-binding protein [Pyrinomonadaceae bacterium]
MTEPESQDKRDQRILILAPTGRDAALTARFLDESGLPWEIFEHIEELCQKMLDGAGLVFLTGEALTPEAMVCLGEALAAQPTWSDIPVVVLTSGGGGEPLNAEAIAALSEAGNVTLIERPVRVATLLSAFKSALHARRRQYEVRDYLVKEEVSKEALKRGEERLRVALDAARLGAWQLDLATGQMNCTALCKEHFGLPADAEFSYDVLVSTIHPEDRASMRAAVERALRERDTYRAEYRVVRPDGSLYWVLMSGRGDYGANGEPHSMAGVTLNITNRKLAEQEREQLLLRERAARAEAEESSRLKDEFLATVSHELRTPLTAVLGWTHLLRDGRLDETATTRALETVERNARAQQQLIEDLLDVSRIITGKLRLDVRQVAPASFIEAAIEAVLPAAEAKGIVLEKSLQPDAPALSGDPARLQQVVWNLISNAIKFTPPGGHVRVRLESVKSHVEISVTDTGDGIRREFLPYVFDRFRQADGTTARRYGGLGLGLAIVRHLVELHGGTVRAESAGEGQGATFTVSLPLVAAQRSEDGDGGGDAASVHTLAVDARRTVECPDKLDGLRVLVVDDEADTLDLIKVLLGQCGAEVATAKSSAEALALFEESTPDVLISDIGMPGEDGYELIRRVRELPPERGGRTPAVALTAYARAADRLRVLRSGYQMHVAKPVELAELVAVVANVVRRV